MSDEPKRRWAWFWWTMALLALLAAGALFVFAYTAAENGGGYFSNGHDSPPNRPDRR